MIHLKLFYIIPIVILLLAGIFFLDISEVNAIQIMERSVLGFDENLSDQEQNTYAPFEKVAVVRITAPSEMRFGDSESWLDGLYYHSITKLGFTDIPFNYVVTWQGEVFESKGGGQDVAPIVDWSASDNFGTAALVAYFDNNQEVTNSGKLGMEEAVSEILSVHGLTKDDVVAVDATLAEATDEVPVACLVLKETADEEWNSVVSEVQRSVVVTESESAVPKGSVENVTYNDTVEAGKNFVVTAQLKNEGTRPWYNTSDQAVLVATSDPRDRESSLYVTDKWASFTRVVPSTEDWVLSGEIGTFEIEIKTPLIPGEYSEKFELLGLPGTWIDGTQFEVSFTVEKGDFELVEILDTETGYLNVRDCPSQGCGELGKVVPGEIYVKKAFQDGWYKIQLADGGEGWVYGKYAKEL